MLNYFLIRSKPKEFLAYMETLAAKRALLFDQPDARIRQFKLAFGDDLDKLDADFLKHMQKVRYDFSFSDLCTVLRTSFQLYVMPRKIRELIRDLERAGFTNRGGKGSHCNFEHPNGLRVTVSGNLGADAKPYQEREVKRVIEESRP